LSKKIRELILFSFLSSVSWSIYKVIFNLFLRDIGFDNNFIGRITSFEMIGSAILGIIIAIIGDKYGKKKTLFTISIGFGILLFLKVNFPVPNFLLSIAFLSGSFQTSRMMLLNSYLIDLTDVGNRGKTFGINFGVMMGSGLFGNFLGGLLGDIAGFKNALLIAAILYISSNILLCKVPESKKTKNLKFKEVFDISAFTPVEKHVVKYHLLKSFFIAFGAGLFVNFGNIIFMDLFDMSASMIGFALSIAQLGAGIGSMLSHKISKKMGPYKFASFFYFIVIPLIISLGFLKNPYMFTIFYAVRFSFLNMTNPVITTVVLSNIPSNRVTTINSWRNSVDHISRAFAAFVFGIIVSLPSGYTWLFLISSVFYALGLVCLVKMFKPLRKGTSLKDLYGNNA